MDIFDELNRRKAQAGQRIGDMLGLQKKPENWFEQLKGVQQNVAVATPDDITKAFEDALQRMNEGLVPPMIRERERAMRTDPSAAAKPFTSQEIKQATPFVTAAAPIAYHGTPHTFDKFDASKIGTGQGAQTYGHGLYFAENPQVAGTYTRAGAGQFAAKGLPANNYGVAPAEAERLARSWLEYKDVNPSELHLFKVANPKTAADNILNDVIAGKITKDTGNMYQVNIPDQHAAKMLDWDKPLSEQPEIRKKLETIAGDVPILRDALQSFELKNTTGATVYNLLRGTGNQGYGQGQEGASMLLNKLGIPGIKYLDQGSRVNWDNVPPAILGGKELPRLNVPKKTYNFVVFDPAILEDVTRK